MRRAKWVFVVACLPALVLTGSPVTAQECPEEPPLQHYTGGGSVVCPCFVAGEEGGSVFEAASEHYPIEILRVGIGWGSLYQSNPQQLAEAIPIYDSGLPDPGTPIFSFPGPLFSDGFINEFDFEPLPGEVIIDSGPFTVTLEFLVSNAGDPYASSMVHDGNGCQAGKNVVFAIPGGWYDACALGVTGDWVVHVIYRQVDCAMATDDEEFLVSDPASCVRLVQSWPNPCNPAMSIRFNLVKSVPVRLMIFAVDGTPVTTLLSRPMAPGLHEVSWDGRDDAGRPLVSGAYFYRLEAGSYSEAHRIVFVR